MEQENPHIDLITIARELDAVMNEEIELLRHQYNLAVAGKDEGVILSAGTTYKAAVTLSSAFHTFNPVLHLTHDLGWHNDLFELIRSDECTWRIVNRQVALLRYWFTGVYPEGYTVLSSMVEGYRSLGKENQDLLIPRDNMASFFEQDPWVAVVCLVSLYTTISVDVYQPLARPIR